MRGRNGRCAGYRCLGAGSNLIVSDEGVGDVVFRLRGELATIAIHEGGVMVCGAGARMARAVRVSCGTGLAGLHGLAGIPAQLGGEVAMNAGGAHGQIAGLVERVGLLTRDGDLIEVPATEMGFGYRRSRVTSEVVCHVVLRMSPVSPAKAFLAYRSVASSEGKNHDGFEQRASFHCDSIRRMVELLGRNGQVRIFPFGAEQAFGFPLARLRHELHQEGIASEAIPSSYRLIKGWDHCLALWADAP